MIRKLTVFVLILFIAKVRLQSPFPRLNKCTNTDPVNLNDEAAINSSNKCNIKPYKNKFLILFKRYHIHSQLSYHNVDFAINCASDWKYNSHSYWNNKEPHHAHHNYDNIYDSNYDFELKRAFVNHKLFSIKNDFTSYRYEFNNKSIKFVNVWSVFWSN